MPCGLALLELGPAQCTCFKTTCNSLKVLALRMYPEPRLKGHRDLVFPTAAPGGVARPVFAPVFQVIAVHPIFAVRLAMVRFPGGCHEAEQHADGEVLFDVRHLGSPGCVLELRRVVTLGHGEGHRRVRVVLVLRARTGMTAHRFAQGRRRQEGIGIGLMLGGGGLRCWRARQNEGRCRARGARIAQPQLAKQLAAGSHVLVTPGPSPFLALVRPARHACAYVRRCTRGCAGMRACPRAVRTRAARPSVHHTPGVPGQTPRKGLLAHLYSCATTAACIVKYVPWTSSMTALSVARETPYSSPPTLSVPLFQPHAERQLGSCRWCWWRGGGQTGVRRGERGGEGGVCPGPTTPGPTPCMRPRSA